jgi:hypothetical protein
LPLPAAAKSDTFILEVVTLLSYSSKVIRTSR